MDRELVGSVSRATLLVLLPVVVAAGLVAGTRGALGALAGGLISLGSFRWVSRGLGGAAAVFAGGRARPLWLLELGFRHAILFGAIAVILVSGEVHPAGVIAGLSVLPPVLIALGLRAARLR